MDFGLCGFANHMGGIIFPTWGGSSSFLTSSSSTMSLENASGLALIQFCKATNGCTQSEPYIRIKFLSMLPQTSFRCKITIILHHMKATIFLLLLFFLLAVLKCLGDDSMIQESIPANEENNGVKFRGSKEVKIIKYIKLKWFQNGKKHSKVHFLFHVLADQWIKP